jgi:hypothetical protein
MKLLASLSEVRKVALGHAWPQPAPVSRVLINQIDE